MPILKNFKFEISREDVYRLLKFSRAKSRPTPRVEALINEEIEEGYALAEPKAVYETYSVSKIEDGKIFLKECDFIIHSGQLAEKLKKSPAVSFFACTVGGALPKKVGAYMKQKETTKAAILDAVGSEAVEGVANYVNEVIARDAQQRQCKLLQRFSPGYGDWDVTAQEELLKLLNAKSIGITLGPSYLMLPEKSISALVGWTSSR